VVVRFHERVVEDRVFQHRGRPVVLGEGGDVVLPPPLPEEPIATATWEGTHRVLVCDHTGRLLALDEAGPCQVVHGPVAVELSLVPQWRLPRPVPIGEGDAIMTVMLLAMTLLAFYLEFGIRMCIETGICQGDTPSSAVVETTPEYIARLLREDFDGAEMAHADRPDDLETQEAMPSFQLPAGNRGPVDQPGGADETSPEPVRVPDAADPVRSRHQPLQPQPLPTEELEEPALESTGVADPLTLAPSHDGGLEPADPEEQPAEEERGWGFQDWLDANDDRDHHPQLRADMKDVRDRLRIDPEDPSALTRLGYYQYLAEEYGGGRRTYERFIELYPDSPAGYNNLGLVYKRLGEYAKEEGYYRLALALDPDDEYALNNLAVNLAHQERFEEALAIMDELQALHPDDAYAKLHRAKILAAMGDQDGALVWFGRALAGARSLDTYHHIEFRQDIRVDPAFAQLREEPEFARILYETYGDNAQGLMGGSSG